MIKVVLDTNIFISALFWKGVPYQIFQKVIEGAVLNFTSPQILTELRERLLDKFKLPHEKVREFLNIIVFNSKIIYPEQKLDVVRKHPADNKIIECAIEANASFIISGDKHLLEIGEYKEIKMLSPREFLSREKQYEQR